MNLPLGMRGKLTALGILVILIVLVFEFLLAPALHRYQRLDDEILDMRFQIKRIHNLAATAPALTEAANALRRDNPLATVTLRGANAAIAAAELQQFIQDKATANGADVISLTVRPMEAADRHLERIMIEARLRTGIVALRKLLFDLEKHRRYLFVEQLAIRALDGTRTRGREGSLDVTLAVYGMRLHDQPASGSGS